MRKLYTPILFLSCCFIPLVSCKKAEKDPIPAPVLDLHLTMGNPSNAVKDINSSENYLLLKPQYTLSYNTTKGTANWVSWNLKKSNLGNTPRQDDFRADDALPAQWYHVSQSDFSSSGFDRGHLCPSGDRTDNVSNNSASFLMTNMIPQAPNNNQYTWQDLESYCRSLVYAGSELYIIAGPYGTGGSGSNGGTTYSLAGGKVIVPQSVWKVVVVLSPGFAKVSDVTKNTRVIAVNMPNTQSIGSQWGSYRVSIDQLETLTGYNFLSEVPESIQNAIESSVDAGPTN